MGKKGIAPRFSKWFNPCKESHVRAYKEFVQTGMFPDGFMPEDVEMDNDWEKEIKTQMADMWIRYMSGVSARQVRYGR